MLLRNTVLFFWVLLACLSFIHSKIVDVTDANFPKVSKKKNFILLYATEKDCKECKRLFPRFVSVSQAFDGKDDILFGKVKDSTLLEAFNVTKFPTIVYFKQGDAEPTHYKGDISVDGLFDKMKKEMTKDISLIKRQYMIHCTYENFQDIIETPNQFKFLLIFDDESKEEIKMMEDFAKIFKNDDDIIFPKISVKERSVVRNFGAERFPILYWYPNVNKAVKKMYGGSFSMVEILGFINQQTGLLRDDQGELKHESGQIKELNDFIEENIVNFREAAGVNMGLVLEKAKEVADGVPFFRQRYADYYVKIISEIEKSRNFDETLENEQHDIDTELGKKLRPKRKDFFIRKKNILDKFVAEHSKMMANMMAGEDPMVKAGMEMHQKKEAEKEKKILKDPKKAAKAAKKKDKKGDKKAANKVEL